MDVIVENFPGKDKTTEEKEQSASHGVQLVDNAHHPMGGIGIRT